MLLASAPSKLTVAFANESAQRNVIPVTYSGVPGSASWEGGFPPETMEDPTAGGVGPSGSDFNGALYAMSGLDVWKSAGGFFSFDATFAAAVGGYPKGALVLAASGNGYWRSTIDNNSNNPDTGGSGWVSLGGAATSTSSSVYANEQQTLASGNAKVLFDTVEFDPAGLWDATDKRFVATIAGKYRVSGAILLSAPAGQLLSTTVYRNGVGAKLCYQAPQVSTGNLSLPFSAIINCAVNDYLEVFVGVPGSAVLAGQVGGNAAYVFAQCEYLGA